VVHQQNMGLPSARNSGIREARGEYLAFLDADDIIRPEKVASQLAYLEAHPGCDLVYSDYSRADEDLRPLSDDPISIRRMSLRDAYAYTNVFPVMSPLLRRSLVERVGDFDPALRACEDWDFWIRCERAGNFGYLPGYFSVYRMHGTQMHKDYRFMLKYCRMVAQKNYPRGSRHYRTMLGSFLWWQFGLRKGQLTRSQALFSPQVLGIALRMLWEVRSPREAWFIRQSFRHGL
ncbi:MAG: glycosyltransferase, partial [Deinococcus sp.]